MPAVHSQLRSLFVTERAAALDLALFAALTASIGVAPENANAIYYGGGIALSFILNRNRAFQDARGDTVAMIARVIVIGLGALLLSTMLVTALSQMMAPVIAKLLSLPAMFPWSYGTSRHFVFRRAG